MAQDSHGDCGDGRVDTAVGQAQLQSHLGNRDFEFKELNDPKPLDTVQAAGVDPAAGEIVKAVVTPWEMIPTDSQSIQFALPTAGAKSLKAFKALSQHIFSGTVFTADKLPVSI